MKKNNIYDFVLDCSVSMAWCFEDESTSYTDEVLESLISKKAVVPTIWSLEVANVLLQAKKNNRISDIEISGFIDTLTILPIITDQATSSRAMHSIFVLAAETDLAIYDAAYLELAIRERVPLLTLDNKLIKAAKKMNVPIKLK